MTAHACCELEPSYQLSFCFHSRAAINVKCCATFVHAERWDETVQWFSNPDFGHRPLFLVLLVFDKDRPFQDRAHICKGRYGVLPLTPQMLAEKSPATCTCEPLQANRSSLVIGRIYSGYPCNLQPASAAPVRALTSLGFAGSTQVNACANVHFLSLTATSSPSSSSCVLQHRPSPCHLLSLARRDVSCLGPSGFWGIVCAIVHNSCLPLPSHSSKIPSIAYSRGPRERGRRAQ